MSLDVLTHMLLLSAQYHPRLFVTIIVDLDDQGAPANKQSDLGLN